ncbi:MAG: ABC transporter ATP-binding protein [Melioribacteraceae bacterium]|jgi:putative ABC transport system ATP-binding protein|nr:ABC transporter ATP-binding protein [Melioribacteraceae bacterium]
MSLIRLENVRKTYQTGEIPVQALDRINLEIHEKSFVSFIGPSGSGKSTLLNLIGCLDKPTEGKVFVNNVDVGMFDRTESASFRGRTIGFVFQNFNLIPVLTVYENVEYPLLMLDKLPSKERNDRVSRLLEKVGMTDQKNKYPNQISGGQKQRVAVARALVTNPQIVLADEPTANLDHATAFKVINIMHEMTNEFGTTFIFSTHDPKIVGEAEVIYTLEDGAIVSTKINKEDKR